MACLGYSFWVAPGGVIERKVATKPMMTFKQRIRQLTRRSGGRSMQDVADGMRPYVLGWKAYFRLAQTPRVWLKLDKWMRHRVRAVQLKQWKRGKTMYRELLVLGAKPEVARKVAANSRCWWRNSGMLLNAVLTLEWSDKLGVPRLSHDLNPSNRPVRTRMPGGVAGERSVMIAPYADPRACRTSPLRANAVLQSNSSTGKHMLDRDAASGRPIIVKLSGGSEEEIQALVDILVLHPGIVADLSWGPRRSLDRASWDAILKVTMRDPGSPYKYLRALTAEEMAHGIKRVLFRRGEAPPARDDWPDEGKLRLSGPERERSERMARIAERIRGLGEGETDLRIDEEDAAQGCSVLTM